jgi:hypothetical protein
MTINRTPTLDERRVRAFRAELDAWIDDRAAEIKKSCEGVPVASIRRDLMRGIGCQCAAYLAAALVASARPIWRSRPTMKRKCDMSEPEKQYFGLLSAISEAADLQRELGCTAEESYKIASERAEARLQAMREAEAESNVIPFRRKH